MAETPVKTPTQVKVFSTAALELPAAPALQSTPLLLIHGAAMSRHCWQPLLPHLDAAIAPWQVDLAGHGDAPDAPMDSVSDYADSLLHMLDRLKLDTPLALCGHSMGGAVALNLLRREPERFSHGVILNSGGRLRVLPAVFASIRDNFSAFRAQTGVINSHASNRSPAFLSAVKQACDCTASVALRDFSACDQYDELDRLSEIPQPCLVGTAGADLATPAKYGQFLTERLPDARRHHLDKAGHLMPMERPADVAAWINAFLL